MASRQVYLGVATGALLCLLMAGNVVAQDGRGRSGGDGRGGGDDGRGGEDARRLERARHQTDIQVGRREWSSQSVSDAQMGDLNRPTTPQGSSSSGGSPRQRGRTLPKR